MKKQPLFVNYYDNLMMYNFLKILRYEIRINHPYINRKGETIVDLRLKISKNIMDELNRL